MLSGKYCWIAQNLWTLLLLTSCLLLVSFAALAQQSEEFDLYKIRLSGYWFYSNPSGTLQGASDTVPVDLQADLGFNSYTTFTGRVDWKFTHKNYFYVVISPFYTTRQTTLTQNFIFQGQEFDVGFLDKSDLDAFLVDPGHQLGSRLMVNNNSQSNRIGVQLTQKGSMVGMESSF